MRKVVWLFIIVQYCILLFLGIYIILQSFITPNKDTTALTNIGFAIFLGLASVSFGWSRAITGKEEKTKEIVQIGESCVDGGLCFLSASAIKFIYLNLNSIISVRSVPFLHGLLKWTLYLKFQAFPPLI